ncbi:hypothetical protein ACOME3_007983 [Neoechinorhynchus agilis]
MPIVNQNPKFSISLFLIRRGNGIPLHDHPQMFGLIRCLHGDITIQSFTTDDILHRFEIIEVKKESLVKLDPDDPERSISALEPNLRNIHEVSSPSQDGVVLDILSPPYSIAESWNILKRQRICQYFKEIETNEKGQ